MWGQKTQSRWSGAATFVAAIAALATPAAARSDGVARKTPISMQSPAAAPFLVFGSAGTRLGAPGQVLERSRLRAFWGAPVDPGTPQALAWNVLVTTLSYQPTRNKLRLVQRFFDDQRYRTDAEAYGETDHWATVGEFMVHGGDCEDFAIAKYRTLVAAGFPEQDLRVLIVEDRIQRSPHAVLLARIGSATFVLDNQRQQVAAEADVANFRPLYSFNSAGVWLHFDPDSLQAPLSSILPTTRTR
jgi:predicted transglutaminase-like cysteine proteinase